MISRLAAFLNRNGLALFSGLLLSLSFPNIFHPDFFLPGVFIAWVCLIPLLESVNGQAPRAAFSRGFFAGLLFFLLSTAWINNIKPMGPGAFPAWICLSLYLALFPAAFAWGLSRGRELGLRFEALWVPSLWTLLEFLRERLISGYPWVSLGSSQYLTKVWLPLASITGIYGLHFVVLLINLLLWQLWRRRSDAWLSCLLLAMLLGLRLAAPSPQPKSGGTKVAVLQGNIDQDQAWTESYRHELMTVYGRLMTEALDAGAQVMIWPESAFPGFFNEAGPEAQVLEKFAKRMQVDLLIGSTLADRENNAYTNSAVFIDAQGNTSDYGKRHLVPFGEYIPFRSLIPPLDQLMTRFGLVDFKPGSPAGNSFVSVSRNSRLRIMPLICYESIYGRSARHSQSMEADLIAVITLDTWFGNSAAPRYHALHGIIQAVESGKWVARAAATGISCFVSPSGDLSDSVALNTVGWSLHVIPENSGPTLYWRLGPWFLWLCLGLIALSFPISRQKP